MKELRKLGIKVNASSVSGLKCLSLTGKKMMNKLNKQTMHNNRDNAIGSKSIQAMQEGWKPTAFEKYSSHALIFVLKRMN